MAKAPDAFRTISEVSSTLDTPAHVLRFWESKFSQIKPVKRAGGRRYYRPEDVTLLAGIKTLLHEQGMTIKGAQKLLREKGIKHVQSIGANETPEPTAMPVVAEAVPAAKTTDEAPATIAEEIAATDAQPAQPTLEISNITAFRRRPSEPSAPELPANPSMDKAYPAGFFGMEKRLDDQSIRAKAAEIAPLLARLETIRDQMRKS